MSIEKTNYFLIVNIFSFIAISTGLSWYVRDNKRTTICENNGEEIECNNDFDKILFIIMLVAILLNSLNLINIFWSNLSKM